MSLFDLIKSKREEILKLADRHGAYNIRLFGSVVRKEENEKSDIDFLVDFRPEVGLFEWSGFWIELEDLLKHTVDVVTVKTLKENIKDRILKEAKSL